jgi:hypothetical protein
MDVAGLITIEVPVHESGPAQRNPWLAGQGFQIGGVADPG